MKIYFISIVVLLIVSMVACKKSYPSTNGENPPIDRKFRFQLYTDKDFSGETSVITFSIFIRNARTGLFDSLLTPMQLKDIPDAAHKLVIEKTVPGDVNSDLAAGFRYDIQNVGHSGYTDTSKAGSNFKVIDYAFQ